MDRPWTVYAIIGANLAGLVWGQVVDPDRTLWDLLTVSVSLVFAWALWTGKQWAFSVSFMLASLCLVLAAGAVLVQAFLLELAPSSELIVGSVVAAAYVVLLLRPETKRFAGFDPPAVPAA